MPHQMGDFQINEQMMRYSAVAYLSRVSTICADPMDSNLV